MFADPADKILHPPSRREFHMLPRLQEEMGMPASQLDLVSAYFVPTRDGTALLRSLAEQGVKIRVLTNSLAATDVSPAYSGYTKYREPLLRAGVRLYELKPTGSRAPPSTLGSSQASLHAKTFAVDRGRIFVGSFNFDPRSSRLNTENGVLLESPALAARLDAFFEEALKRRAYEVRLTKGGDIEWIEQTDRGEVHHASTPETNMWRRAWATFLSWLPIEWLL
jgi:putative cardiolipin synthase